jgi:hypothetical protein
VHQVGFSLHDCINMHSQQNIKFTIKILGALRRASLRRFVRFATPLTSWTIACIFVDKRLQLKKTVQFNVRVTFVLAYL